MKLDNEFTVGVPIGQAWGVLTDLELIAPCMPGAQLTGVTDGVYTGKVKVKVGPVTAEYSGTARFAEKDDEAHRAVIEARGRDSRGNGNASATIAAQLSPTGTSTLVTVTTDLTIAGRVAQFGSGMIKEVSAKLLGQFVECLEGRLGGDAVGAVGPSPAVTAGPGTLSRSPAAAAAEAAGAVGATATAGFGSDAPALASEIVTGPGPGGAAASAATATDSEPAPLDLMSVAGRAVWKRLAPVVIGLVVLAVVIYVIVANT
ncbi:MAG TPA: SRPBCC family protein [Streptosporangiaceae bacterium]|nr:SRPBCC family protein [Streptosporangiaceae bacterium]